MDGDRNASLLRFARKAAAKQVALKWDAANEEARDVQRAVVNAREVVLGKTEHDARVLPSLDETDDLVAYHYRTNPISAGELYTFATEVLGYKLLRPHPHDEQCAFYVELVPDAHFPGQERRYGMILVPRDTFKSTIGCVSLILYLLVKNPNLAMLIGSYRHDMAQARLRAVKTHIERNKRFIKLFGNWCPKFREELWNEDSITITARDVDAGVQVDPSVDTCGVDRPKEGGHFDVIILDDIHNRDNVQTPLMRNKVYEFVGRCIPMLKPGGSELVIGTRWHHQDAYGKIQRDDRRNVSEGREATFKTLIRGAINRDGTYYFPERLGPRELDKIRHAPGMTEYLYKSQYFNETVEDAEHFFPSIEDSVLAVEHYLDPWSRNSIIIWDKRNIPVLTTLAWDTAGHRPTADSDFHGLTVVGCDPVANWWVLEGQSLKDTPNEVVRAVARLIVEYRPHTLSIEVVAQSGVWITLLRNYLMQNKLYMPYIVENRPPPNMNKLSRIDTTLEPLAKANKLLVSKKCIDLVNQMAEYPQVDHFDVMDSLAQHRLIVRPADPAEGLDFLDVETMEYDRAQRTGTGTDFRKRMGAYPGRSGSPRSNVALRVVR